MRTFETEVQDALKPAGSIVAYLAFPKYLGFSSRIPIGFYLSYIVSNADRSIGGKVHLRGE